MKELFKKMLHGECTEAEAARIISYLQQADTDEDISGVEEVMQMIAEQQRMDSVSADRIFERIVAPEAENKRRSFLRSTSLFRLAAAVALFITAAVVGYVAWYEPKTIIQTVYGQLDTVLLDDGTQVVLNANTEIRVNDDFLDKDRREVWLHGEAFFSVVPMSDKPFIVHTKQGMDITVLGTAFNVNTREDEARVVLSSGSVRAAYNASRQLIEPGETVYIAPGSDRMQKSAADTLYYASWRYKLLAFRNEPLWHVANTIKDRYGYDISFADPGLENLRFTGSVPADNLSLGLHMIALTFELDVEQKGNTIAIRNENANTH
ncbi:FecR family protein [Parapedobacter tibetensis]|nr:FecR domain-containing protein [Parapedobacter tibetensis]